MLTLVTSNVAKYKPFAQELERMRIKLEAPMQPLPELQGLNFVEGLEAKARAAAQMFGRPVLVDDAGLVLEAYAPFPGPLTATVVRSLGVDGLRRLLTGVSHQASMECHLGIWIDASLRTWSGKTDGKLDFNRVPSERRMILSDLFVPDSTPDNSHMPHRALALASLAADIFQLHLDTSAVEIGATKGCSESSSFGCPFCAEFEADPSSIYANLIKGRLQSRVLYEDEYFVVMPPLGEFMEGGLLLLSREHIPSFAWLNLERVAHLERLLAAIRVAVIERWGVPPLVFEHGPTLQGSKGGCCVDHAHFNLFPASVRVQSHLAGRISLSVGSLSELRRLVRAEYGYLFVQENDGTRRAYDAQYVPSQLVRRIITSELGVPNRWHWQDYPGIDELLATYDVLKGKIRL